MRHTFSIEGEEHEVWLDRTAEGYALECGGNAAMIALEDIDSGSARLTLDGEKVEFKFAASGDLVHIHLDGRTFAVTYRDPVLALATTSKDDGHNVLRATMPGVVISVHVSVGEPVSVGTPLVVIESMKLETMIKASRDGIVETIHVADGQTFDLNAPLVTLAQDAG